MRNRPYRSQLSYVACLAVLLAWQLLTPGHAIAQDTCRDTIFFLPCDYWAGRSFDTSAIPPSGGEDTMAVPPGASAPMSGMSGIWDGAQIEVITTNPQWVGVPYEPGKDNGLALDSKSRVYVVYTRPIMKVCFAYKDPGQPWSPEILLPASPTPEPHAGVVICPDDDMPEFLYLERGNYLVHATYDFGAGQWAVDTIVHSPQSDWPSWMRVDIEADSVGGFHVVWEESAWNQELQTVVGRVMYAENTAGVWRTQIIATIGVGPHLRLHPSGRALIAYLVRRDNHEYSVFATNRFRGDTVWTADSVDTAPAAYSVMDMRLGTDGTLHVLFGGRDCYYCMFIIRLFYTRRPPGSTAFEPWYQLFDHAGDGRLMVDCAGHAHVWYVWYDDELISHDKYYATNSSGMWATRAFHFGSVPDRDVGHIALMLDRFDQGRAVLTESMDDGVTRLKRLLYYASPTVYFDVFDVVRVIDHVYGGEAVCDPYTYDEDCNGSVDAADVVWIINYCFSNGPNGCRF